MTIQTLASNWVWVPICALALLLIVWDWRASRRYVIATAIALALGGGLLLAAEIIDPIVYCNVPPISEYPYLIRLALGCF